MKCLIHRIHVSCCFKPYISLKHCAFVDSNRASVSPGFNIFLENKNRNCLSMKIQNTLHFFRIFEVSPL